MKARCIHSDVCILLDETKKDCYDTFTDGTPHNCEYYLSSDFQNQKEKVLEVPLKSLKSVIGLAFSFSQLPEEVRNQLIEVDNFYHKAKELRQSREGQG